MGLTSSVNTIKEVHDACTMHTAVGEKAHKKSQTVSMKVSIHDIAMWLLSNTYLPVIVVTLLILYCLL